MSGIMGEELTIVAGEGERQRVAPPPYPNGAHTLNGATVRVMPEETRRVHLEGKYAGWFCDFLTSAPFGTYLKVMDLQGQASTDEDTARRAFTELVQLLPDLLADWNFVDRRGEPIPISAEGLLKLPMDLISLVFEHIGPGEDADPKASAADFVPISMTGASPATGSGA